MKCVEERREEGEGGSRGKGDKIQRQAKLSVSHPSSDQKSALSEEERGTRDSDSFTFPSISKWKMRYRGTK